MCQEVGRGRLNDRSAYAPDCLGGYGAQMSLSDRIRLALLRGRDNTLHRQIAGAYARGNYVAKLRAEQQQVRQAIRRLEGR